MSVDTTKTVERHVKLSRQFRRDIKADPAKARQFLLKAGIAERSKHSPSGVRLAKRYR